MIWRLWPIYTGLIGITGMYALLTFGILLSLSGSLTIVQMLVAQIVAALLLTILGVLQMLVGVYAKNNTTLATGMLIGALGSLLVALAGITVVIIGLVSTYDDALRTIGMLRNAGLVAIGLSVVVALSAIGTLINQSVQEAVRELDSENE